MSPLFPHFALKWNLYIQIQLMLDKRCKQVYNSVFLLKILQSAFDVRIARPSLSQNLLITRVHTKLVRFISMFAVSCTFNSLFFEN